MTNIHTIDLSSDNGEILTALKNIADKSKERELKNIELHSEKISKETLKKNGEDLKKNKRRAILDRWEEIQAKRYKSYQDSVTKRDNADKKFQLRVSKSGISQAIIHTSERRIRDSTKNLTNMNEESTQETLERKVEILKVGREHVNTDIAITAEISPSGDKAIRWQTNDVFIRETSGEFLDYNFGKFDVVVKTKNDNNATTFTVSCKQVGETEEKNDRKRHCGYPHPHINSNIDGNPCLGIVLDAQLIERMKVMDVTGVIVLMSEFLSSYNGSRINGDAPYVELRFWVPNRSDCRICRCCDLIRELCTCGECFSCREDFEDENISECGSCHTCCMKLHKYIDSEELGPGLNGTQCFLR
ncbi:MAG: hypothetical protein CL582_22390 [Alteromonadaceae bacterium]|nr:hypothetical protein [Alteromonadaceae bacterium]|tara:strand:- start:2602 stop:3678 length:1077 start_codon:yes stop_codon:yes gene_type:complete